MDHDFNSIRKLRLYRWIGLKRNWLRDLSKKSILLFSAFCQGREMALSFQAIGKLASICSYTHLMVSPTPLFTTLLISLQQVAWVALVASRLTGLEYLMTVRRSLRQMVLDIFHGVSYKPCKRFFHPLFIFHLDATVVDC